MYFSLFVLYVQRQDDITTCASACIDNFTTNNKKHLEHFRCSEVTADMTTVNIIFYSITAHTYVHTHMHIHTHTFTYTYSYIHAHPHSRVHTHTYTHTQTHLFTLWISQFQETIAVQLWRCAASQHLVTINQSIQSTPLM